MTKARHGGADYVYSLLTGYRDQAGTRTPRARNCSRNSPTSKTPKGLHYNPYFANLNIAMPPPLTSDGQVQYADGTKPTVDQMAQRRLGVPGLDGRSATWRRGTNTASSR